MSHGVQELVREIFFKTTIPTRKDMAAKRMDFMIFL